MKIGIDPGHGYSNKAPGVYDPGAGGKAAAGNWEADIVLLWALELEAACRARGVLTWMSRDDRTDPDPLGTRDNRAQAAGCNLFVSIHTNAGAAAANGTETFYRDDPDRRWANIVHETTIDVLGLRDRGIKTEEQTHAGRLAVLSFGPPACLVELGFITSTKDRVVMLDPARRRDWATRLATAVRALAP